jgi:hypothetical protein
MKKTKYQKVWEFLHNIYLTFLPYNILMKYWAALFAILLILTPIASYAQAPTASITVKTFQNSKAVSKATDISVTVQGQLEEEGLVRLLINGKFASGSNETHEKTFTFSPDNLTHVFELDYQFLKDETYVVTVTNGLTSKTIKWIPLGDVPEKQKQATSTKENTPKSNSISDKVSTEAAQKEDTKPQSNSDKLVKTLREENNSLKQTLEKKNAVIMEQIKVIQELASKFTNTIYLDNNSKIYFVAESSEDLVKSLKVENESLKKEIEKKNAVIMEQVKVIQELASKFTNTIYETTTSNLIV